MSPNSNNADALVFFGATGDLAYKKIFPALQAMVKRCTLNVPLIGVARGGWNLDKLKERAKDSGEKYGGLDSSAFESFPGYCNMWTAFTMTRRRFRPCVRKSAQHNTRRITSPSRRPHSALSSNTISPGAVDTPMHANDDPEVLKELNPRAAIDSSLRNRRRFAFFLESAPMVNGEKFELMEEHMQAPSGKLVKGNVGSRLSELGIVLPIPPIPLGVYVESSDTGNLLFLSGTLPVANGKLAIAGRLGANLSVKEGQEAARIASLNALAIAKEHLGDLSRLKKLVKLTVLMATTEQFAEHAPVADGASNLFVQIFGREAGHVRLVYGVYSLPIGTPVIVDTIFEIET